MKPKADPYRVSDELNALLERWGHSLYSGMPRVGYPTESCGGYSVASKDDPYESAKEKADYEKVCKIIDLVLPCPRVIILMNKYRYRRPLRLCVKQFQCTEEQYLQEFAKTISQIEYNMEIDLSGVVDLAPEKKTRIHA